SLVEVAMVDRAARQLNLTPSQVMRREVYTKQLKGQTMVRKLLMWRTNKEREIEDFPAFVIHFTDFSPNRKTPLERDIRVSNSREQIDLLWKELAEENIVKGWVQVGGPVAGTTEGTNQKADDAKPAAKKGGRAKKEEAAAQPDPTSGASVDAPLKQAAPAKKS